MEDLKDSNSIDHSIPEVVYKYRDWENTHHKKFLIENELYLSSPKDFNDPFDCRINKNFHLLSEEEKNQFITDIAIKNYESTVRKGTDLAYLIKDLERRFQNIDEIQKFADHNLFSMQDDYYAIFSCSKIWNSILMWSHYSNFHKGFCVGLSSKAIIDSRVFGKFGEVLYQDRFPELKPRVLKSKEDLNMEESFLETHTKAKQWEYEKEVRFMTTGLRPFTKKDRVVKFQDELISEVIIGIEMPESHQQEINSICKTKNIPVYKAKKKNFEFDIDRDRIV